MGSSLDLHAAQDLKEVLARASSFLEREGQEIAIAQWLLRERFDLSSTDIILNKKMLTQSQLQVLTEDLLAVAQDYPPQYQVGHCWFYGRAFRVTEDVLIPRPETEEMVDMILQDHSEEGLSVLDIGTGSGVIPISLKAERPSWQVFAGDISPAALEIAQWNANKHELDIDFRLGDLSQPFDDQLFNLVVSNPPYISHNEYDLMGESVKKHEPQLALFAEREGLAIYERLAQELPQRMKPQAEIYLELGFKQGEAVKSIMQAVFPQACVDLRHDLAGHNRVLHIKL